MVAPTTVLVVEDNPGDARLIAEALRGVSDSTRAEYVERLEQALSLLASQPFDVVLLDLSLPDSHGLETLKKVTSGAPHVPIVVLTAIAEDEMALSAVKLGAQDYVIKGQFDQALLLRSIRYARERYQQKEALLRSWRECRAIIELAPDGIALIRDGRIVFANSALASSLEYRVEELIGMRLADLLEPGDVDEQALVDWLRCSREPDSANNRRELRLRRRGGQVAISEACVGPPVDFEGAKVLPLTARDVTERKRMEARLIQTDRIATLGALSAGIAHEINNPLSYLVVNLQLVAEELDELMRAVPSPLVDRLRSTSGKIYKAREGAERVRQAAGRFNAYARAETGPPRPIDIRSVVAAVAAVVRNEIRQRARLVTELDETPLVMGDDARLRQVLLNLVVNAAHNIPEGRADQNEIRVSTKPDGQGFALIEVRDTGPGIPSESLSQIFDPSASFPASAPGGGLGLSIARSIVLDLGGRMEGASTPGGGSVFRVALPAAEHVPTESRPTPVVPEVSRGRGRLLVVDDEPDIGDCLSELLAPNYDVIALDSGREALRRLTGPESFDAILCDLMMPIMTGMDLYQEITRVAPQLAERFIFMTGGAFTPRAHQFLDSTHNLKLEKPFDIDQLERLLSMQMSRRPPSIRPGADGQAGTLALGTARA